MGYRLLLDENVEYEVSQRLEHLGHDVEHVESIPSLGKGTVDMSIAEYSRKTSRIVVTYDDDFVLELPETAYYAAFYIPDWNLSPRIVVDCIHAASQRYPQSEITGLEYVSENWV